MIYREYGDILYKVYLISRTDKPTTFCRPRPLSASLIDDSHDLETLLPSPKIPTSTTNQISPKFKSFSAPNPWNGSRTFPRRSMDLKQNIRSISQSNAENLRKSSEEIYDYDERRDDYDVVSRHSDGIISSLEVPKTIELRSDSTSRMSDIDSPDSAVGSIVMSQCGTSSERSPKWGRRNRKSYDLDSASTFSDKSREDANEDKALSGEVFKVPSLQVRNMDLRIIDTSDIEKGTHIHVMPPSPKSSAPDVTSIKIMTSLKTVVTSQNLVPPSQRTASTNAVTSRNTTSSMMMSSSRTLDLLPNVYMNGAEEKPGIVPSPLKSCYASISNYEITVEEVSDSENSSVNGDSVSDLSRSNIEETNPGYEGDKSAEEYTMHQATPPPLKSIAKVSLNSKVLTTNKYNSDEEDARTGGGYGRGSGSRRTRKKNDTWDPELLVKKFRESSILHLERFKKICEESKKKRDDLLLGLRITMAKNGHRF